MTTVAVRVLVEDIIVSSAVAVEEVVAGPGEEDEVEVDSIIETTTDQLMFREIPLKFWVNIHQLPSILLSKDVVMENLI